MTPDTQMWLTSEGGTVFAACGTYATVKAHGDRYKDARVAVPSYAPCCHVEDMPCSFDLWGDEHVDALVILGAALQRAEGRGPYPFWRCPVHGHLTFGGCCESPTAAQARP